MWATRPHLANIFEKLLDQKTFVCLRLVIESQLSNKFAPQMWATRPHLASIFEKLLDQKTFVCLRLVIESQLSNKFASQMWAARPHLGSIFEKLLHRKTFYLPAVCMLQPASYCPPYHKNFTVITAYPLTNVEKKRIL